MKFLSIISLFFLLFSLSSSAQVGINTTDPQASLDVEGDFRLSPNFSANQPTSMTTQATSLFIDRSTGKAMYAPEGFNKASGGVRPGSNTTIATFPPKNTLADVRFVLYVHNSNETNNSDSLAYVFGDFKVIAMGSNNPIKFLAVNIKDYKNTDKTLTVKNDTVISWINGTGSRFGSTTLTLDQKTGDLKIKNSHIIFSYFFQIFGGV